MGQLIHVDFENRLCAYTVEFYEEPYRVTRETTYAANLHQAQSYAVCRAMQSRTTVSIMLYLGEAKAHNLTNPAVEVMLLEDIQQFARTQVGSC